MIGKVHYLTLNQKMANKGLCDPFFQSFRCPLFEVSASALPIRHFLLKVGFSVPKSLCIFWLLLPACLDCLNLFWFRKMLLGALKAFASPDADGTPKPETIKKRDQVKQYVKEKYVNFKSIIMRRKPAILRRRAD